MTETLALLAEQAEWRVFVDGTKNLGHQASTVLLLRRLIETTGFGGRVVVVYADHGRVLLGCTADKLALMFPGVDPRRLDDATAVHGPCRAIRFLPLQRAAELREAVAFGFTGGADDLAFNGAAALNVRFFMRLQPYLWDDPPSAPDEAYPECSRIEQPDGRHLYPLQAWPALHALPIQPPPSLRRPADPASSRWYARQQDFDAALACRVRNALAVLAARDAGLPPAVAGLRPAAFPGRRRGDRAVVRGARHGLRRRAARHGAAVLVQPAAGGARLGRRWPRPWRATCRRASPRCRRSPRRWRYAVRAAPARGGPPPPAGAAWTEALGPWLRARARGVALVVHRARTGAGGWRDVDASLAAALARHGSPAVHLVEVGPVAMDVFHRVVAEADLPCVIEGQATANLLTTLGRPFLQLPRREGAASAAGAAADGGGPLAAGRELRDLVPGHACDGPAPFDAASSGRRLDRLARWLDEAGDASSATGRRARQLATRFARPQNDKLSVMLLALREVMLAA